MEKNLIEEQQLSHLLQLLTELGNLAEDFVLVGGQALRFRVKKPRVTKDFDFVLDVIALRQKPETVADVLDRLGYEVVPNAERFQFQKRLSNSAATIRIEFLAPERDKERRPRNIRVDVQTNVHARACLGAEIALKESDHMTIRGVLPNGQRMESQLRVVRPHALLLLKLFAMDDRMKNIRGPDEAEHDREEARIHAADIISIVHDHIEESDFRSSLWSQLADDMELQEHARSILSEYFAGLDAPGVLLYAEFLKNESGGVDKQELERALRETRLLFPDEEPKDFS